MTGKILCTNMAWLSQSKTATTFEKQTERKDGLSFPWIDYIFNLTIAIEKTIKIGQSQHSYGIAGKS